MLPIAAALSVTSVAAQTAPGTTISNTATVNYATLGGQPRSIATNAVDIVTVQARTDASAQFLRLLPGGSSVSTLGPTACLSGGAFVDLPVPTGPDGTPLSPGVDFPVTATALYSAGETVFVEVNDPDQNLDSTVIDTVTVTVSSAGDTETLRLNETGVASGVFTGFISSNSAPTVAGDCALRADPNDALALSYEDSRDPTDLASANATINPVNVVFDATTGELRNGVLLTLVDAATGLPATVFGNDGVSAYPATVRSGEALADASGLLYAVPEGGFLFPVVPAGNYRLVAEPPAGFLAPSTVAPGDLASLPGGPFAITDGSFARPFVLAADELLRFDVPVDPVSGGLFITKATSVQTAAPGDFVQYRIALENTSDNAPAIGVVVSDELPPGFVLVADSLRIDDVPATVARRAGGFDIDLGTLAASARVSISYVVEVTGGVRGDEAINIASARSDRGLTSNKASAAIQLRDELFRQQTTIIGRVVAASCDNAVFDETDGVPGIRIYMEDGRYAVTDDAGRYHFEGVRPGLHNVQLDDETVPEYLEIVRCDADARRAGSARSMFLDARGGALQRADFFLRRRDAPAGRVDIELENQPGESPERIDYRVHLRGVGDFPVSQLTLTTMLPAGVNPVRGSARLADGSAVRYTRQGPALIMRLGERTGAWSETVTFSVNAGRDVEGLLETRALATFDTPSQSGQRTPAVTTAMQRTASVTESADYTLSLKFGTLSAELTAADRAELDAVIDAWRDLREIEITALGHSDNVPIAARNRDRFADNYALSAARAQAVADYLSAQLAIAEERTTTRGLGPDRPVDSNDSAAGRQKNRRVELIMRGARPAQQAVLETRTERSGEQSVVTTGPIPGPDQLAGGAVPGAKSMEAILKSQKVPLPVADSLSPGTDWVAPVSNFRPAIPSIHVAVQHEPGQRVLLAVNDVEVPALSLEGVEVGRLSKVALTKWRAVRLDEGRNTLTARVFASDGSEVTTLSREVHFAGGPLRAELVPEASYQVADGKQKPIIAVRLFDGAGELARTGSVGRFQVDAPYRSAWEVQVSQENSLVAAGEREPLYRVEPDGIARIELEPTTTSGELVLRLQYDNQREQEIRTWLKPAPRDWILVGLAHGTAGYNRLRDNMEAAQAAGIDEHYVEDGRVAFFAKGRIRGEYLLTLAYDSSGDAEDFSRFEDVIDPNAFYTLYADATESRFEAASQRKLYVKLEREQFSLLFGDYNTGLSVTELARYERRFNGLQVGYNGTHIGLSAFAAESLQSFQRDEIRGNGTSGLYRLSSGAVLPNSDTVVLEVRDRVDASRVLTTTTLTRFVDYSIDYAEGTLLFKRPIASRDDTFNPQFIVASYETRRTAGDDLTSGGRIALRNEAATLELGASLVREAQQNGPGDLLAADLTWQATPTTRLRGEYVDTQSNDTTAERRGHGYRLELEHRTGRLDVEAYHARVDANFGLGQQNVSEIGLEKTGVNGRVRLGERLQGQAEIVRQENLDTGLTRDIANASLNTAVGGFNADVGVLHARDEAADGERRESTLARVALGQQVFGERGQLRLSAETPLNDDDAVTDYPSRVLAGIDWNLGRTATAFVEHEIADGEAIESKMTRVGLRAQPWQRARFDTALTQEASEFGPRLFATIGAVQGWQFGERWMLDVGVDQSNTMLSPDALIFDPERELISGSQNEDFFAAHVGAAYNADAWTGNLRAEHRNADRSESMNVIAGLYRESVAGHGLSAALEWFDQESIEQTSTTTANLRIGWAYRLPNQRWSFLNRTDLVNEERVDLDRQLDTWRVVNNFAANWRVSASTEMNFNIGAKYVSGEFDQDTYSGTTTLVGAEWRRTIRPRWDIGVHGDVYHSWRPGVSDFSTGFDIGYSVAENTRVTLGFNVQGFRDDDFTGGNYTAEGAYLRFAIKADQDTLRRIAGLIRR